MKAAGFDPGPIDGIAGSRTQSAIRSYQRAYGLIVDGYVTPDLFVHLESSTYERQAQTQFARGNYEQAAESYTWLIMMRPTDANAYFNRGLTYSSAGLPSRAIDDFSVAVHLDPMHVKAQFGLGEARYQTGMYQEALSAYSRAAWAWIKSL